MLSSQENTLTKLEPFEKKIRHAILAKCESEAQGDGFDLGHDALHFERVYKTASQLARDERADPWVVMPASFLHDWVNVPKNDPRRSQASRLSAEGAIQFLSGISYPPQYLDGIAHAIEAHSFSAAIACRTKEAQVVQDADRLDALGAIGLARLFVTAQRMKTKHLYGCFDSGRALDDRQYCLDHIEIKLRKVASSLQTEAGRLEGARRMKTIDAFVAELRREIKS